MTAFHRIWLLLGVAWLSSLPAVAQSEDLPAPKDPSQPAAEIGAEGEVPEAPGELEEPASATAPSPYGSVSTVRPSLMIVPFDDVPHKSKKPSGQWDIQTSAIGYMLETELSQTGRFNIVPPPAELKTVFDNLKIERGNALFEQSTMPELGQFQTADYILVGTVVTATDKKRSRGGFRLSSGSRTRTTIEADFRLVETATAEVVFATRAKGEVVKHSSSFALSFIVLNKAKDMFRQGMYAGACLGAVQDMTRQLEELDSFPVMAEVQGVTEDELVYVDLGLGSGFYEGLVLEVRKSLPNPLTGEPESGLLSDVLATLVADEVSIDYTICRLQSGSVESGDLALLPEGILLVRPDPDEGVEPIDLEAEMQKTEEAEDSEDE